MAIPRRTDSNSSLSSTDSNAASLDIPPPSAFRIPTPEAYNNERSIPESKVPFGVSNKNTITSTGSLSSSSFIDPSDEVRPYTAKSQQSGENTTRGSIDQGEQESTIPRPRPRNRTGTFGNWFHKQSDVENSPQNNDDGDAHSRRSHISRQMTLASPDMNAFLVDATLPSDALDASNQVLSLIMDSDSYSDSDLDSDSDPDSDPNVKSDDIKRSETATTTKEDLHSVRSKLKKAATIGANEVQSVKRQVTQEVKEQLGKLGFFDPEFHKLKLVWAFIKSYLFLTSMLVGIFSLYWGSLYQRESRMTNMHVLILLDDPNTYTNLEIDDYISNTLKSAIEYPTVAASAGWTTEPYTSYTTNVTDLDRLIEHDVYHQKIWAIIKVTPNATLNYFNALQSNTTSELDLNSLIEIVYETGREYVGISSYLSKSFTRLQTQFQQLQSKYITIPLTSKLTRDQITDGLEILGQPIQFTLTDLTSKKLIKAIVTAPQQFGLVYLHVLSLMQLTFFQPFHAKVALKLNDNHFMIYRIVSSQITYLVIGLSYTLVQLAFSIDIYTAYPAKVGFLVFWLVTYLMLSALGGINENVVLLIQCFFPHLNSMWMFFYMVANVAPIYYPMVLSPQFYRYVYALPIKNGFEIYKMLLFNTWKLASLPRNLVLLLFWAIATHAILPTTIRYYSRVMNEKTKKTIGMIKKGKKISKRESIKRKLKLSTSDVGSNEKKKHSSKHFVADATDGGGGGS